MKFEVILGRIFLSLVSILLAFLLFDYASLWFLPKSRSLVEREFPVGELRKPKPYVMFGGTPNVESGGSKGERLNSLGYRGKEPSTDKAPGEFRIFLLGGSAVLFGGPTIAVLLEEEFHRNGFNNINVYNFGVLSSVSGMELSRILFEISDFKPDMIVMYNGGNDIMQPFSYDPRPGYPFNFIVFDSNPLFERDIRTYPTLALFAYGSNTLRYLFPSYFVNEFVPLQRLREEAHWGSREWEDKIVMNYVGNLVKADKVSRSFGAQFIAFFQPLVYFKEPLSDIEKQMSGSYSYDFLYMREMIRSEIKSSIKEPSLGVVDISDIFDGLPQRVFSDPIHILQEAYPVVAMEIYKHIVKYVPKNK